MTASDVVNTLTISLSFVTVWSIVIILVASQSYREKVRKKRNDVLKTHSIFPDGNGINNVVSNIHDGTSTATGPRQTFLNIVISFFASDDDTLSNRINASKSSTSTSTRNAFRNYILSYFPAIYQSDKNLQQLFVSILTHHQYFLLLSNKRNNIGIYHSHHSHSHHHHHHHHHHYQHQSGYSNRWLHGFHLLSLISSNMFVLAMFFDIRMPSDDGSCPTFHDRYHHYHHHTSLTILL